MGREMSLPMLLTSWEESNISRYAIELSNNWTGNMFAKVQASRGQSSLSASAVVTVKVL